MTATRLLFVSAILLPTLLACSHSNEKWENDPDNDRTVHFSGTVENLSPRDVRIALAGTDVSSRSIPPAKKSRPPCPACDHRSNQELIQ